MIIKMKKVTMIVCNNNKEEFLLKLRKQGLVHIKSLASPSVQQVIAVQEEETDMKNAIAVLSGSCSEKDNKQIVAEIDIKAKVKEILSANEEKEKLEKTIHDIRGKMIWYEPWGEFVLDDIAELRQKGIDIKLYILNKDEFKQVKDLENIYVIKKTGGYFAK